MSSDTVVLGELEVSENVAESIERAYRKKKRAGGYGSRVAELDDDAPLSKKLVMLFADSHFSEIQSAKSQSTNETSLGPSDWGQDNPHC